MRVPYERQYIKMNLFLVFLFLICCDLSNSLVRAENLQSARTRLEQLNEVTQPTVPLTIVFVDKRVDQKLNLNLSLLEKIVTDSLSLSRHYAVNNPDSYWLIEPMKFEIYITYYGLYKTESGVWGIKAVMELNFRYGAHEDEVEKIPITYDKIYGHKNKNEKEGWESILINGCVGPILDHVSGRVQREQKLYKQVIALGFAPTKDSNRNDSALAVLNALSSVCDVAWGIKISSTTEVVDLANITSKIRQEGGCSILGFDILPEYTVLTEDGFICVVVKAITGNRK
jgi:hypothetical protein